MKLLKRDLVEFEYLRFTGEETDVDPDTGLHTGVYRPEMAEPEWYEGNISPASLLANQTFFGEDLRYTHVLLMDDTEAEIDEYGEIRWEGNLYDIRAVRKSGNVLNIALRRRTKNHTGYGTDGDGE